MVLFSHVEVPMIFIRVRGVYKRAMFFLFIVGIWEVFILHLLVFFSVLRRTGDEEAGGGPGLGCAVKLLLLVDCELEVKLWRMLLVSIKKQSYRPEENWGYATRDAVQRNIWQYRGLIDRSSQLHARDMIPLVIVFTRYIPSLPCNLTDANLEGATLQSWLWKQKSCKAG